LVPWYSSLQIKHMCDEFPWYIIISQSRTYYVLFLYDRRIFFGKKIILISDFLYSPPVFSGVRVTRSLVLCECFVDRCLSFCTFSFGQCFLLRYTDSDCPFGIVKLFLLTSIYIYQPFNIGLNLHLLLLIRTCLIIFRVNHISNSCCSFNLSNSL